MNQNINKFSDKAENYAKYRLDYSNKILEYFSEYNFNNNSVIADIGSGTGKLSKIFLDNGNMVYGIEPNDNMREMANKLLMGFDKFVSVNGSAENTTLQNGIIDFVVVGQAFHWFDANKALYEFKRIIKNNGVLALIWYHRKTDTPFWNEYENILIKNIPEYKGNIHRNYTNEEIKKYFVREYRKIELESSRELSFNEVMGSFSSGSYAPKEDTMEYKKINNLFDKIFNDYNKDNKIICNYGFEIYMGKI